MKYSKKEMIAIGKLIEAVDIFETRIRLNIVPDKNVPTRKYVQVRSSAPIAKGKRIWLGQYIGKLDCFTPEALAKGKDKLRKRCHDLINQELAVYNCKIEDFN